jgi:hypothetical protein
MDNNMKINKNTNKTIVIDGYIFKLINKGKIKSDASRTLVKIECSKLGVKSATELEVKSAIEHPEVTFYAYRSQSELGTWRLAIYLGILGYQKPGDYVTGTFIHCDLQQFINENLASLPENLNSSTGKEENFVLPKITDPIFKYSDTRSNQICKNKTDIYDILSNFCNSIRSKCGAVKRMLESFDIEILNKFIQSQGLDMNQYSSGVNNEFMYEYVFIVNVIEKFIVKNFVAIYKKYKYQYVFDFDIKDDKCNIIVDVYEVIIREKKTPTNSYKYYYIKYAMKKTKGSYLKKYTQNNNTYYFPLFIIPSDSKINQYGNYDCFLTGCFYFCKPFEYTVQCSIKEKQECTERTYGAYYFIGDLISQHTAFTDDIVLYDTNKSWQNNMNSVDTENKYYYKSFIIIIILFAVIIIFIGVYNKKKLYKLFNKNKKHNIKQ